ncbi:MAG TPA: SUMF1/EgtB/PvdO family nonheme iron enzyme [Solirubrobacteraceae bacterium]|nr:SUMF1/EgtB/PvdO family nonheme iron enzyme [Solirubrobacteraceae bacterium]
MASSPSLAGFSLTSEGATAGLRAARERTLELVAGIENRDLERLHSPLMSPLAWDLGHIAAYEDLWLAHRHGGLPLLHPELASCYDAFETPRARRSEAQWLRPAAARAYMAEVRARVLEVIAREGLGDGTLHEMVIQHERQHNETMLQTLGLARLDYHRPASLPAPAAPAGGASFTGLGYVEVPGGPFELGAPPERFSYDNERPAHPVEVESFEIGVTPVTNGAWLEWIRQGGYDRRECWSDAGWEFSQGAGLRHPGGWIPAPDEELGFREWRTGGAAPLAPERPVVHVSWFEAQAFARSHGARLPTEAEWERAATFDASSETKLAWPWGDARESDDTRPRRSRITGAQDPVARANFIERRLWGTAPVGAFPAGAAPSGVLGMLGDVWEWTGSDFNEYPGFEAHPYREYSEVFFGDRYKVLRGGSWASSERVATPTFRNWDLPQRRQIFAGLRLARDL